MLPLKIIQRVRNSLAKVVSGSRGFDHITSVLKDLHCLPVREPRAAIPGDVWTCPGLSPPLNQRGRTIQMSPTALVYIQDDELNKLN